MFKKLNGVTIHYSEDCRVKLCIVNDFSDDIKNLIRKNLTSICHGPYRAKFEAKDYHYKKTLRQFQRIVKGSKDTRKFKGLMGELLAHLFINYFSENLAPVSLYYNLEDRSMTKGYDILYSGNDDNELWITEVKSGETTIPNNLSHHRDQIGIAKRDLKIRLNTPEEYRWRKAKNAFDIVHGYKKERENIKSILTKLEDDTHEGVASSRECNVILCSTSFSDCDENLVDQLMGVRDRIEKEELFKHVQIFAITKRTFQKVMNFLENEVK